VLGILFIFKLHYFLGHACVENLRTDNITDEQPHRIYGTKITSKLDRKNKIPNGVS